MMNKLYKFSAFAALLAGFALSSCNNEEADIFDQSAAHRTEEAKQVANGILHHRRRARICVYLHL